MKNIKINFKKFSENKKGGFTLLEMLVVIGIFGLLTATVTINYMNFNSKILLNNIVYDVALKIQIAQANSVGVRQSNTDFGNPYGMYFYTGSNNKNFIYFKDVNKDGICQNGAGAHTSCRGCPAGSDCITNFNLPDKMFIERICYSDSVDLPVNATLTNCAPNSIATDNVHITFKRPKLDAIIKAQPSNGSPLNQQDRQSVGVIISGPENKSAIIVNKNGQIYVKSI